MSLLDHYKSSSTRDRYGLKLFPPLNVLSCSDHSFVLALLDCMDSVVDLESTDFSEIPWGTFGRTVTLGVVSLFGKAVLNVMNTTNVINREAMHDAAMHRPSGVGLITVSNHTR